MEAKPGTNFATVGRRTSRRCLFPPHHVRHLISCDKENARFSISVVKRPPVQETGCLPQRENFTGDEKVVITHFHNRII